MPKYGDKVFRANADSLAPMFLKAKKKVARNTGNENFLKITFKCIRKWRINQKWKILAPDIVRLSRWAGHKRATTTEKYLYDDYDYKLINEYDVKMAKTLEEFAEYSRKGYDLVGDKGEYSIFRRAI